MVVNSLVGIKENNECEEVEELNYNVEDRSFIVVVEISKNEVGK